MKKRFFRFVRIYLKSTGIWGGGNCNFNAECVKLRWSKTITDIPACVTESLETIIEYVENEVRVSCTEIFSELTDEEENEIFSMIKKYPDLLKTLGTGVILKGEQQVALQTIIEREGVLGKIKDALTIEKNVIIF